LYFKKITKFNIDIIYKRNIPSQLLKNIQYLFPNLIDLSIKHKYDKFEIGVLFPPSRNALKHLKKFSIIGHNNILEIPPNLGVLVCLKIEEKGGHTPEINNIKSFKFLKELIISGYDSHMTFNKIPQSLLKQSLRLLYIDGVNAIDEIPQNTGSLHYLRLYSTGNIRKIPERIGPELKSLLLFGKNKNIKTIPSHMGSLKSLIVIFGKITTIPSYRLGYPKLRVLEIHNHYHSSRSRKIITEFAIRKLPKSLNPSLKILSMDVCFKPKIIIPETYNFDFLSLKLYKYKNNDNNGQVNNVKLINKTTGRVQIETIILSDNLIPNIL
jgi:hypothetical protein